MSYVKQHELGIIGLALLRNWLIGDPQVADVVIKELKDLLSTNALDTKVDIDAMDVSSGYRKWSEIYDKVPNLLIDVEEPVVRSLLSQLPTGKALDAACGTGRYSKILNSLGFSVTGMDLSEEMLNKARAGSPEIKFVTGELTNIPIDNDTFDTVVMALALTHLPTLEESISELARITKVGGHIITSDIHPWMVTLGGQADFYDSNDNYGYVRNYVHWHSNYFEAFKKYGLKIVKCLEPAIQQKQVNLIKVGFNLKDETVSAAFGGLPLALIWELEKS